MRDGSLDYPDTILAQLDFVIAAVHAGFKQSKTDMTRRICRALAHPRVRVLAHPTGRLIGERDPYALDLDEVLRTACRHGKAVEINASPERLDLNAINARRAHELGALVAVSTDAHTLGHLGYMELGVATARRAWTEQAQVVNAWKLSELLPWMRAEPRPRIGKARA